MIKIVLKYCTEGDPLASASHAAKMCYQAEPPQYGELMDVERALFKTGHHTTLEHFFCTFEIEGIAVGDVTLGLHLAAPFYNSDQRSGRFCTKMFADPDIEGIMRYIRTFWPDVEGAAIDSDLREYLRESIERYRLYMQTAPGIAQAHIEMERPSALPRYAEQNAPKFAREQARMFIPVIFPTGLDYTVNLVALSSLYHAAWSPVMRYATQEMVNRVIERFPKIAFMFDSSTRRLDDWEMPINGAQFEGVCYAPRSSVLRATSDAFRKPSEEDTHPLDLLHYIPERMENGTYGIESLVEMSLATMGQDQRHRTIHRGMPSFTSRFYAPPLVKQSSCEVGLDAERIMSTWLSLAKKIPRSLAMVIAPYGATVAYRKTGSFNAIAHEQAKRLCWCAQEEIYHLSRALRNEVLNIAHHSEPIERLFDPPCRRTGICTEGARYCGRDMHATDYFTERIV